jgi:hypothetical protein
VQKLPKFLGQIVPDVRDRVLPILVAVPSAMCLEYAIELFHHLCGAVAQKMVFKNMPMASLGKGAASVFILEE